MANDKETSEARCKLKGKKSSGEPPRKKAQGNNSNSIVTTEQGQGYEPKHQSPADHPLFGVRRYVHKNHNASNPVLHVKVTDHLSYKNSGTHIKGCVNDKLCGLWFQNHLPVPVKDKVKAAGFSEFANLLARKGRRDKQLISALAERWWDTTHTFHLDEVGELTMTPKDFSAITSLPVCGKPLKYDMEAHKKPKEVVRLFGTPIASLINTKIKYRDIVEKYKGWKPQIAVEEDQLTRVFILALIGSILCNDKSDSVYLYYMPSLAKVDKIKDYNWGGAGLSFLYLSMDAISRRIVSSSGGYWRAWEVWACEYLKPLALSRPCTDEDSQWPRALRWLSAPDVWETSHNLEQFRITLRYITTDQVNWYPWGTDDTTLPHYVQSSIPATKQRILLEGPVGYAWYLGERVSVQSLGAPDQRIPKRPHQTMLKDMKVYAMDNETKASLKGFKADDWFAESTDYGVFRNEYVRYKHYPSVTDNTAEGVCSVGPNVQGSEIKIPPWIVQVVGWGDADDCEVLDIPRGKSTTCLPLPKDVKYVSASTATQLLDMISGLNSLLFTKCMAARTIISELRQGTNTQHNHNRLARKEIVDAEDKNEIDDEDDEEDEENDNGFETSCEDGENGVDNDNDEEQGEDEEDKENEEDEENEVDELDEENEEDEEVEENGDEDENDQQREEGDENYQESEDEDEEDEVLMKKFKTKSPPPNPKGKEAVVKTKCKGGEVHTKEKAAAIKAKGKASLQKRKTSLPEPEPQPISKRLRKKT